MNIIAFALLSLGGAPEAGVAVTPPLPMVGGFKDIETTRDDVQEAALFAAGELGFELAGIEAAQSKAVAAFLFRLDLAGEDGSRWRVEVTKPLRGGTWSLRGQEQLEESGDESADEGGAHEE